MDIPQEFAEKTKEQLYEDIVVLSAYINKQRIQIEELKAQLSLKNGEVIKKRGEILGLKSHIGYQNMHISELNEQQNNIIDLELTTGSII